MPKVLYARTPEDAEEERKIYKLSRSRHAPGDWIFRARIISLSWWGLRTTEIAEELGCHPKTVRKRLHRFNALGIDGLGDRPGSGRKPRLTEDERSRIIALVAKDRPGKLLTEPGGVQAEDEEGAAYWTLQTLAESAREMGIEIGRSQVRRILLAEGVRWRNTRPWAESAYLRSSPQKIQNRRALHQPAARLHGGLRRRAGSRYPSVFPSGPRVVAGRAPHQSAAGIWPRPGQGVGVRRPARGGRQLAYVHLALKELRGLHKAAPENRAGDSEGDHPRDRRQPQNAQKRPGQGVAGGTSQDRACVHPEGSSVAEPDRGVVEAVPQAGFSRGGLRRQLRDRPGEEGRHATAKPESQPVGVGTTSKAAEASEAHICVPYLRNGALEQIAAILGYAAL